MVRLGKLRNPRGERGVTRVDFSQVIRELLNLAHATRQCGLIQPLELFKPEALALMRKRPGWQQVEEFCRSPRALLQHLDAAGNRPVHVSEICAALGVSRRTLHRAFQEVFGLGPVSFLRHKRLCAVHSILRESAPGSTTVAAVAMGQGFYELGRFAQYYLAMFGERPSQTLNEATLRAEWDGIARTRLQG